MDKRAHAAERSSQRERSSWACRVSSYLVSIPAHVGPLSTFHYRAATLG